jgi:hypothetical protein
MAPVLAVGVSLEVSGALGVPSGAEPVPPRSGVEPRLLDMGGIAPDELD